MRIAQIAPLWERVPPRTYGGTERVVSLLTEELVRRGHDVTLFASGDSITSAKLEAVTEADLRSMGVAESACYDLWLASRLFERADDFDIVHNHMGAAVLALAGFVPTLTLTTLHGDFTQQPELCGLYRHRARFPYVSISDAQREPLPELNYVATIHHGIPTDQLPCSAQPDRQAPYLAFLGRVSPEKGLGTAIAVARRAGWTLKIGAKIDPRDRDYFAREIAPSIDGRQVQFLGELDDREKAELLGGATATLCPIRWREPFGLVLLESLACGTPVVAFRHGSVPELISHGETGFICENADQMVEAIRRIDEIDRTACRRAVERDFSVAAMVDRYERVYELLIPRFRSRARVA